LRWHARTADAVDQALSRLSELRDRYPQNQSVLNDFAAVSIEAAARDQSVLPLLRGLDAVEEVVAIDSTFGPALFNRALILERLSALGASIQAWQRYVRVAPRDNWAGEASAHLSRLKAIVAAEAPRVTLRASLDTSLADALRAAPHHSRELGMRALGDWAQATLKRDPRGADSAYRLATASLKSDGAMRDGSTGPALAVVTSANLTMTERAQYARAYGLLSKGQRLLAAAAWDQSLAPLDSARRELAAFRSPLSSWAALYYASSQVNLAFYAQADSTLNEIAADSTAEPELVGRALLALGVSQVRQSSFERANELYAAAVPFLAKVHDRETVGFAAYLRSEGFDRAGQVRASRDAALDALRTLAPLRRSNYLNNQLTEVAAAARDAGLPRAALAVMNDVLEVAAGVAKPETIALAYSRRARDQFAIGRKSAGEADLDSASAWSDRMRQGRGFERIRAAIQLTTGELRRKSSPEESRWRLDSAVQTFRKFANDLYLPSALYEAAATANATGDRETARNRLNEAVRAVERMQTAFRGNGGRAIFADRVERVSDRIITMSLDDGHFPKAFEYLERARAAVLPVLTQRPTTKATKTVPSLERLRETLSTDELFIEYALLDDRIAIWTASRRKVEFHSVAIRRDTVAALVAQLPHDLRLSSPPATSSASARLFDVLLGPISEEFRRAHSIIVVPDRELYAVPFAGLWNTAARRFVVEDVAVRETPSAAFFIAASSVHSANPRGTRALIIGDPSLSPSDSAAFGRLPGAAREARDVAALYPSRTLRSGASAKHDSITSDLLTANIVHFAGHAVFDSDRPELSYLALSSDGRGSSGRLTAREIGDLRLSNTRVVVLSACSTLNPRPTRAGAAAGLAYSFLNASVASTISTLWDVSDVASTAFLISLHRALAVEPKAGSALHRAQVEALHSSDPLLRAPFIWAAFTFTGHD
jgi:CHAT domain-containing protein